MERKGARHVQLEQVRVGLGRRAVVIPSGDRGWVGVAPVSSSTAQDASGSSRDV